MQSYFYIIDYGQILEKTDILEGSCDTCLIDVDGLFAGDILAIQGNNSLCGFIYAGQQIKYGSFSGTIGTDQSIQCTFSILILKSSTARSPPKEMPNFFASNNAMIIQPPFSQTSYS